MTDLVVNGIPVAHGSRGTRRYYASVMRHLAWPGRVEIAWTPPWRRLERLHELLQRGRRDAIFWSPAQRGPLRAHHHVVTVLDCINVRWMYRDDWRLRAYKALFNAILDGAEAVATISQATKDSLLELYRVDASKVRVIPTGCDLPEPGEAGEGSAGAPPPGAPFVLLVTNALVHKNTRAAGLAFARSRAAALGVGLTVVGSTEPGALDPVRAAGGRVELLPFVEDAELHRLYRTCAFLLGPSLEEGYDLPVAEALVRGANVLCSDIAVHREYFGGRVRTFDPASVEAMTAALDEALALPGRWFPTPPGERPRTFVDVAAGYRALFEEVAGRASRPGPGGAR